MNQMKINRVYHPWQMWECYRAGFYETAAPGGMKSDEAKEAYRTFLSDLSAFRAGMERVGKEWPHSCQQFLTNPSINRIAWLGQSAMCITTGVPACFRGGFSLLTPDQQDAANAAAQEYLTEWEAANGTSG
jgi:hypothetical protein